MKYHPLHHEVFERIARAVDCVIVRINPGEIKSASEQARLDELLEELEASGTVVEPSPLTRQTMGGKDVLCAIAHLPCGLACTAKYDTADAMLAGLCRTLAAGPRVIKQCRGSAVGGSGAQTPG